MTRVAWIVGGGGLLGKAVVREAHKRPDLTVMFPSLPWHDSKKLADTALAEFQKLLDAAQEGDWSVLWVAGAAVTSSTSKEFDSELAQLRAILSAMTAELASRRTPGRGAFFYASSAGGVYGGSPHPPFTEQSPVAPISDYGRFKLQAESAVSDFSAASGIPAMLGRIANLYGPGQRLDKAQGLISHIARAQLSPKPASIFVPLETIRDYLYVDDCAAMILDADSKLHSVRGKPTSTVKILASGQGTTIASILGYFRGLAKSTPNVMIASSPLASLQAIDLRLNSTVWTDLDRRSLTPLPVGIFATMQDILGNIQAQHQ